MVLRDMVGGRIGGGGLMDSLLVEWLHQLEQGSDEHRERSKEYVEVGSKEKVAIFSAAVSSQIVSAASCSSAVIDDLLPELCP